MSSVLLFTSGAFALPVADCSNDVEVSVVIDQSMLSQNDENVEVKLLTAEEFQRRYQEITGEVPEITRGGYTTAEVRYTDDNLFDMGYGLEVGCLVRLACGQSCSWDEVLEETIYSILTKDSNAEWDEAYAYADLVGPVTDKRIELRARGSIVVAVSKTQSNGGTMGVGLEFVNCGYTYSNSIGTTDYFRKTGSIRHVIYESDSSWEQ